MVPRILHGPAGQRCGALGWDDVHGDTIRLRQKKTGVRPVCPIFPELAAEMQTWERRPGPFLLQDSRKNAGMPISTNRLWKRKRDADPLLPLVI
ncbi:hypothetical protein [Paracoccus limosus]|uniref:hypothetical protein n=1 Tax=Paracoccus limosus TaxID=913252 RepID=UPI0012B93E09|nr:hypothetical protein [Paracoccus limosus]